MSGIGLMVLLLLPVETATELLQRAETEFRAGVALREDAARARPHFHQAARALELLQEQGANNPHLALQLGNARMLADDLAGAILAYHRGLDLAPGDPALRDALEYARTQVAMPAGPFGRPPRDEFPLWFPRPGPATLLTLTLVALTFGCVALTRQRMTRTPRWLLPAAVAFLLAGGFGICLVASENARARTGPLVVIAEDGVLLRRGDGLTYAPRYETPLARGVEARLRFERGTWLRVELSGGETGWVPRELTRR